jgi:hypothetical protein
MGLIAVLDWVFYARTHFRGPSKATLDAIEAENHMEDRNQAALARSSLSHSEDEKVATVKHQAESHHVERRST